MPRTEGAINKPVGYARYTALSSAIDLIGNPAPNTNPNNHVGDAGTMSAPVRALIQCDTQDVRWTDDGTTPTSTVGMLLPKGTILEYEGALEKLKFIEAAASASLSVAYYRY